MTMRNNGLPSGASTPVAASALAPASILLGLGPLVVVMLFLWFATWSGEDGQPSASTEAAWVLIHSIGWPMAWIGAAIGFGWPLQRYIAPRSGDAAYLQSALGIAAMLWIDETLGVVGILQRGGSSTAIAIIVIGLILLTAQIARAFRRIAAINPPHPLIWTAAPAGAVLLLAACSAPGWLWTSEFGGYDAIEYHLQLPKEWLALGHIAPLHHNVYSYFPGYVEAAFYHLACINGSAIDSAYSCQLLHALMTLITAGLIGRLAFRSTNSPIASSVAYVFSLGTPWMIVTGSLAYNDIAPVMMLAAGIIALRDDDLSHERRGTILGILAATACAAKLTSAGLVALPLGAMLLTMSPPRAWWRIIVGGAAAGLIVLAPWLLRNWYSSGNPVFPFATSVLGLGHWSAEQAAIFSRGHQFTGSVTQRFAALWNEFLREGMGVSPLAMDEPWEPQWSILPWLGTLCLLIGCTARSIKTWSVRWLAMLAMQLAFWLTFTHLKARFLLPAVVPLALGVSMIAASLRSCAASLAWRSTLMTIIACALIAWSAVPVAIFRLERGRSPVSSIGMLHWLTGEKLTPTEQTEQAASFPAILINTQLSPTARILMIGDAKPFYILDQRRVVYQATWDRGPLSRIVREHPDDSVARVKSLKDEGFTHVLVDPNMLARWERSTWNDPLITADGVVEMCERHMVVVRRYLSGETMYQIR